ncbi:MAG TPA: hypothetical protein VGF86_10365 [Candidatus Tumulicola sp.]|jgi:pyruvate carboxylase
MVAPPRISWPRIAATAVVAGLAGGTLFDLYLWATTLVPAHQSVLAMWQWTASTVFGKGALTDPRFAAAGAVVNALVSVGWAGGYAYVASVNPLANRRWAMSGVVYGLIVYTIMQTILLADNNFTYPPNPNAFVNALVAHAAFFGLPVAYVVRAMGRTSAS